MSSFAAAGLVAVAALITIYGLTAILLLLLTAMERMGRTRTIPRG
jgi:hypothetical protein